MTRRGGGQPIRLPAQSECSLSPQALGSGTEAVGTCPEAAGTCPEAAGTGPEAVAMS